MEPTIFAEQIIERKPTLKDTFIKTGIWIGAALLVLIFSLIHQVAMLTPLFAVVLIVIAVILIRRMNVEFEYILTGSELDVDKIYAKTSRKHLITINLNLAKRFAPVSDETYARERTQCKVLDYTSSDLASGRWFIICGGEGQVMLLLEPNEKMLEAINRVLPRGTAQRSCNE